MLENNPTPPGYRFNFGRHHGKSLEDVLTTYPQYIVWVVKGTRMYLQPWHLKLKEAFLEARLLQKVIGSDNYEADCFT
jgi:hypothetical protein